MKTVIHRSENRGKADHGWLRSNHSFSFAQYHDPQKMGFGLLRVLNDDLVAPAQGFGTHPHRNMEIISIPLSGALEHKDNMGNTTVIKTNDVQIMSAGTGVAHSEYNHSSTDWVNFLQLWIFPKDLNITPRYDQKTFSEDQRKNQWQTIVSPLGGDAVAINQNASLHRTRLKSGETIDYAITDVDQGVYLMVLEGAIEVDSHALHSKDAMGIWDTDKVSLQAKETSEVLLIEVPMN